MSDLSQVMKACEAIEAQLVKFAEKSDAEIKAVGKESADTKAAIDGLATKQRELADEILQLKQRGAAAPEGAPAAKSWGDQFIASDDYKGRVPHSVLVAP